MPAFAGGFNAGNYEPSTGEGSLPTVPDGIYDVAIIASAEKDNRARTGTFYEFTLSILKGEHQGKKLIARFNVSNPNPEAVRIALSELSALSWVCGLPYWTNTEQLHGRNCRVKVTLTPRTDDTSKMQNNVVGYLDAWGNPPTPANSGQSQGQASGQYPSQQQQPPQGQQQPPQNPPQGQQPPMNQQPPQQPPQGQQPPFTPPAGPGAGYQQTTGGNPPVNPGAATYQQQPPQPIWNPNTGQWEVPQPPQMGQPQPPQGMAQQPPQNAVAGPGNSNPPPNNGQGQQPPGGYGSAPPWG